MSEVTFDREWVEEQIKKGAIEFGDAIARQVYQEVLDHHFPPKKKIDLIGLPPATVVWLSSGCGTIRRLCNDDELARVNKIQPSQEFTFWEGGECPVPDGLEVEVVIRDSKKATGCSGEFYWPHDGDRADIIAYRLTGNVMEGWEL